MTSDTTPSATGERGAMRRRQLLQVLGLGGGAALLAACSPGVQAPALAPTPAAAKPAAPAAPTPAPAAAPTPAPAAPAATAAPAPPKPAAPTPPAATAVVATAAPAKPAAGQPRLGGNLRVGILADVANVDGHSRAGGSGESFWMIFDPLIELDDTVKPQPMLAESWDLNPDYKQIKFNLRKGVQWHSGREFTSDDVKWNLLRVRDPKVGGGNFMNQSSWFTTIETPDKNTVILKSESSRPALFDLFENLNMVDPTVIEANDPSKAGGTGPFALQEWVQGDHLTFVKNKNYWVSGRPYLDSVQSFRRNAQAALLELEAGSLDIFRIAEPREIARLKADPNFFAYEHPNPGTDYEIIINTTVPPFDNKKVRQALNYALDRKRCVEQIYLNTNRAQALPWSLSSPAYDAAKNNSYAFDLDKARALLREANVSSAETDLIVIGAVAPLMETFMQIYQADLAKIGIQMKIVPMEAAAWLDQIFGPNKAMMASGDNSMHVHPSTPLNAGPSWKEMPNTSGHENPRWNEMLAAVASETDPAKQKTLFAAINDFILEECWNMPVCSQPLTLMARRTVKGLTPSMHTNFMFTGAWLDP